MSTADVSSKHPLSLPQLAGPLPKAARWSVGPTATPTAQAAWPTGVVALQTMEIHV